jgi:hypothetical protein
MSGPNQPFFKKHVTVKTNIILGNLQSQTCTVTDRDSIHARVNDEVARTFLKELYFDLILRFCRVADNQFRKDLIKSFGRQKSETLRKKVVETQIN